MSNNAIMALQETNARQKQKLCHTVGGFCDRSPNNIYCQNKNRGGSLSDWPKIGILFLFFTYKE